MEEASLKRLAGVGGIERADGASREGGAHAVLQSGAELFVPLAELIDMDRERARLGEELERVEGLLKGTEQRLANENFTSKAPADVVEKEREKAASLRDQAERLSRKLAALK